VATEPVADVLGVLEDWGDVVVVVDAVVVVVVLDEGEADDVCAASSSESRDSAAVSEVCADDTSLDSDVVLSEASVSPAVTC
jgi:hypothetical protein